MPEALPPGSIVGILGGGQLGRMLALAAARLGLKTHIYSDEPNMPAFDVSAFTTIGSFEDEAALSTFAVNIDVITCEFENVPARALEIAGAKAPVHPPAKAFAVAQDRLVEKNFMRGLGIPVADYANVHDEQSLRDALGRVQLPAILKTRRLGYDGKGQALVRTEKEAIASLKAFRGKPVLIESLVAFEREISVVVVRGQDGVLKFYDTVENVHQHSILSISRVPARIHADCDVEARHIAGKVAKALGHVGVLCVEMFQREDETPRLLVNEIAPRVHNSGHWTIDGCLVSQFENHIRAIAGWHLGDTERHSDAVMTNLIGADVNRWRELAAEDLALHLYGKAEARPGRKMGHTTRLFPKTS
ncbi:MAG TPA: 5-(carboxyamino)imidazole ribonucleotide synthase [Methyloceanibacter sp.]|nr:5-(carboxyamino)imidazole ribonucleotide synthase [Methyloceanibacter sp.]